MHINTLALFHYNLHNFEQEFWSKVAAKHFFTIVDNTPRSRELGINFMIYLAKKLNTPKYLMEIVDIFEAVSAKRLMLLATLSITIVEYFGSKPDGNSPHEDAVQSETFN